MVLGRAGEMVGLECLGLNENLLTELPPEIGKLKNLQLLGMCPVLPAAGLNIAHRPLCRLAVQPLNHAPERSGAVGVIEETVPSL